MEEVSGGTIITIDNCVTHIILEAINDLLGLREWLGLNGFNVPANNTAFTANKKLLLLKQILLSATTLLLFLFFFTLDTLETTLTLHTTIETSSSLRLSSYHYIVSGA